MVREPRSARFDLRLGPTVKQAFSDAADLADMTLTDWITQRLMPVAAKELRAAGKPVAFEKKR